MELVRAREKNRWVERHCVLNRTTAFSRDFVLQPEEWTRTLGIAPRVWWPLREPQEGSASSRPGRRSEWKVVSR